LRQSAQRYCDSDAKYRELEAQRAKLKIAARFEMARRDQFWTG
jgi:hypothetical protein